MFAQVNIGLERRIRTQSRKRRRYFWLHIEDAVGSQRIDNKVLLSYPSDSAGNSFQLIGSFVVA
jgi:hypothetical protein